MRVCAFKEEWGVDEAAFSRSVWLGMAVGGGAGAQLLRRPCRAKERCLGLRLKA